MSYNYWFKSFASLSGTALRGVLTKRYAFTQGNRVPIKFIGVFIVIILGALSVYASAPTIASPFALITVLFTFLVSATPLNTPVLPARVEILSLLAAAPLGAAYYLWASPLGVKQISRRSHILAALTAMLSSVYFFSAWPFGEIYQGKLHTLVLALVNSTIAALLLILSLWRQVGRAKASLFDLVLFSWLAWCAFPWLGEVL